MSNFNIYEDQENRVPVGLHERGLNLKHGENNVAFGLANNLQNQKLTVQSKRTVLSSINVSSNVRVQPRRAAKQGVCYEAGFPQQADENVTVKSSKSNSTSSLPSFTIHEDSNSSCSSSSGSTWSGIQRTSSSSSCTSSSTNDALTVKSAASVAAVRPKLKEIKENLSQSPVKNKLKTKQKQTNDTKTIKCITLDSPEAMDVSMSDGGMLVDTPSLVTTLPPREEILEKKDQDFWDVPEYAEDIYSYLRDAEVCHKPRANYMQKQTDITTSMRWILVDWLVEVTEEYSLHTETLYLAVSYIDRFLSQMSVKRDKLQLVGTTAMFIASKYEEIYPPDVAQFAYITDNTYRVSQILRMEQLILKVLSFDMAVPTALVFVNYFTKLCKSNEDTLHLAMFLSELSMLDSDPFLRFLPSRIAAAALALANYTLGKDSWPKKVAVTSGYSLDDLRECYVNLHRSFCKINEPTQHAIRDKYKAAKWHSVSLLSPRDTFPW